MTKLDKTIVINWETYHLNKDIPRDLKDTHHIISKKLIQVFKVNDPKNKIEIQRRKHVALNNFFWWDAQAPHLQLKKCLEIWWPVLSKWVKEELYALLTLDLEDFYDGELVKEKWKKRSLFDWSWNPLYKDKI